MQNAHRGTSIHHHIHGNPCNVHPNYWLPQRSSLITAVYRIFHFLYRGFPAVTAVLPLSPLPCKSLLQMCGATTAKAWLPTVDSLMGGNTRRLALVQRSVHRPGKSSTWASRRRSLARRHPYPTGIGSDQIQNLWYTGYGQDSNLARSNISESGSCRIKKFCMDPCTPIRKCSFLCAHPGLHLICGSFGPQECISLTASWLVQPFLQGSRPSVTHT